MNGDWKPTRLGTMLESVSRPLVLNPETDYRLLGAHWYAKGLYIKEEKKGSEIRANTLFEVRSGDFVYNRLFAWKGSFAVASEDVSGCVVSNEFPCFSVNRNLLEPGFLWLYFSRENAWNEALGLSSGSTPTSRNRLKERQFLSMEILRPPLEVQRCIVSRVEELTANIIKASSLREQTKKQLAEFSRGSISDVFADVAKNFGGEPLGKHVKIQGGYAFKSDEYLEEGLPIVRIANLEDEGVHIEGSPHIHESRINEFQRFILNPGDILIAMTGATTGKLGIVPDSCVNWLLNQRVGRFIPRSGKELEPKYVYWLARGVQKRIFETAYGGAQPNISPTDIEEIEFPFPPIDEQRRIVARLDMLQKQMHSLTRLQDATASELDALIPSILDKAFRGEL